MNRKISTSALLDLLCVVMDELDRRAPNVDSERGIEPDEVETAWGQVSRTPCRWASTNPGWHPVWLDEGTAELANRDFGRGGDAS